MGVRRLSITAVGVLQSIANGVRYGFDVIDATGLESGTVYPILSRLERDGLLSSRWEDEAGAHAEGRPARRYYHITPTGRAALEVASAQYLALVPSLGRSRRVKS
jgi:PadR family transcriptional regulator PadR